MTFADFLRLDKIIYIVIDLASNNFSQWHVIRASMKLRVTYMKLYLSISKIDFWRQEIFISIAAIDDNACSIRSLQHLFNIHSVSSKTSLFQLSHDLFSRQYVVVILKILMRDIDDHYFDHSFRRDVATQAHLQNLSKDDIRTLDRWKFDVYRLYIDRNIKQFLIFSRKFQNVT